MKELIKALQIFAKYTETSYPTHCEHDVLWIMDVTLEQVSAEDIKTLDDLGFFWSDEDCFQSFKFGSA